MKGQDKYCVFAKEMKERTVRDGKKEKKEKKKTREGEGKVKLRKKKKYDISTWTHLFPEYIEGNKYISIPQMCIGCFNLSSDTEESSL